MALRDEVAERYPSLLPLLSQPEIGGLLTRAVRENWSAGKFQSQFIASRWFRSQSESQRRWWITQHTDPGEARQQMSSMRLGIRNTAYGFGYRLNDQQATAMAQRALAFGWQPDGPEILDWLSKLKRGPSRGQGAVGVAAGKIRNLAEGAWFTRPNWQNVDRMAENVALGRDSIESINERFALQARQRYPHLAEQIMAGQTLADITAPLREIIANELERTPESIQINGHPVWRQLVTGIMDPDTKKVRQMTESEAMRLARRQPAWWKTSGGRAADAGMARTLLEAFGKRG